MWEKKWLLLSGIVHIMFIWFCNWWSEKCTVNFCLRGFCFAAFCFHSTVSHQPSTEQIRYNFQKWFHSICEVIWTFYLRISVLVGFNKVREESALWIQFKLYPKFLAGVWHLHNSKCDLKRILMYNLHIFLYFCTSGSSRHLYFLLEAG